ncbi:hypothetical protein SY27_02075 [Flavobacterium sp. 316]|uniref:hypothetical protein n=1 Tax=Flavobacterium sp. 316 TaxID=1603293 RepID=UPI0005DB4E7B|nr:hypothetical protein [Flavobacterium sp. 316]KIX22636.1 hypothetical protein SY27_02075 [Flavobacterium sp. 316]
MKASKTLGRPENWQDFESLCKKLWGEIWQCPEIKKNGRAGQEQNGVDVYGIPSFDNEYYGIQCKGKDEYTHKQLSEKEIEREIEKAKSFEPKLKKLYFATTAVKDSEIEKVVRLKNQEHKKANLFEVHLFSWEDIVDLIEENRETYNYYVNSINFKSTHSVALTFPDNTTELTIVPKFRKRITHFKQKIVPQNPLFGNPIFDLLEKQQNYARIISVNTNKTEINYSYCQFYLRVHNTGDAPIEEYKIFLEFEGEIADLSDTNEKTTGFELINLNPRIPDTFLYSDSLTGEIVPRKSILVGDDTFASDDIFLKPYPRESKAVIKWKLVSKTFKQEGSLLINIKPDIETTYNDILIEDPLKVRTEESDIEDYIVEKKDEDRE